MSSLTLLLIRHAEKPGHDPLGPGLTIDGRPDKKSLVIRGWHRAGAWAVLFGANPSNDFPQPEAIFAAAPDTIGQDPSQRPYETIQPLAERLNLTPTLDFPKGEEKRLAQRLAQLAGVVLVCWEHKALAEALLPALVGTQQIDGLPSEWDDARFDVVLRFDRDAPDTPWSFRQLFPRLLANDSDRPL
jgi:broad specificity phosphatase PhoE